MQSKQGLAYPSVILQGSVWFRPHHTWHFPSHYPYNLCFGSIALVKPLLQYGCMCCLPFWAKTRGIIFSENAKNVCGVTWPMVKDSVHACVSVSVLRAGIPVWNTAIISNLRTKAENTTILSNNAPHSCSLAWSFSHWQKKWQCRISSEWQQSGVPQVSLLGLQRVCIL